ncbi:hypothetical protein D3C72_1444390 [compost metagenome]
MAASGAGILRPRDCRNGATRQIRNNANVKGTKTGLARYSRPSIKMAQIPDNAKDVILVSPHQRA